MTDTKIITRDYQGQPFLFREDGYFNMTKAAQHFGKRVQDFLDNKATQDYCATLASCLNHADWRELTFATRGRYHGGTWGHPKLAVFFARWLDVKFAVWCDMVIDDLIRGNAELTVTKSQENKRAP